MSTSNQMAGTKSGKYNDHQFCDLYPFLPMILASLAHPRASCTECGGLLLIIESRPQLRSECQCGRTGSSANRVWSVSQCYPPQTRLAAECMSHIRRGRRSLLEQRSNNQARREYGW